MNFVIISCILLWIAAGLLTSIIAMRKEVMQHDEPGFKMFVIGFVAMGLIGLVLISFEKKI